MESFFRYVGYIHIFEQGKPTSTVGYLLWKYQGNKHELKLQIRDRTIMDSVIELREETNDYVLAKLRLQEGYGEDTTTFYVDNQEEVIIVCGNQIKLKELTGLKANLKDGRKLYVRIELPIGKKEHTSDSTVVKKQKIQEEVRKETTDSPGIMEGRKEAKISADIMRPVKEGKNVAGSMKPVKEQKNVAGSMKPVKEKKSTPGIMKSRKEEKSSAGILGSGKEGKRNAAIMESRKEGKNTAIILESGKEGKNAPRIMEPLKEDKWDQLCKKYKVIYPFTREQKFISIHPGDFVILQEGYQKLVHNSFLLHGYYNYGHLILGKIEDKEEAPYYVGVPGVYYEREKKTARMFGFIGFEGANRIIENGSYGYYMIEVKI